MRKLACLLAGLSLIGGGAAAQQALTPGTPSILVWSPQQQSDWYRSIESVYHVNTIHRGDRVEAMLPAAQSMATTFTHDGRSWSVDDYMQTYKVSGLLVLKDGKVLLERYGLGRKPTDRWTSFSVAKSVTSTLVGAAIKDGKIKSLNAHVTDYVPELKGSGYEGVTVRQLLMMSSGVRWNEDYADPNSDVSQAGLTRADDKAGVNPMVSYMRKLPRARVPGSTFNYNTGETDLVGIMVSKAVGKSLADYASEKIWKPYGMEQDAIWMTDTSGQERGGCCISMTLRDYGRVGQFILDGGKAQGKAILPADWVAQATSKQIDNGGPGYGYFWWMLPGEDYQAVGIFGQSITTFRKDRVIIVINSAWPQATGKKLNMERAAFVAALHAAAVQ